MTIASLYDVTRQIGSGGGGIIYLGRHRRLDKDVVLKADKRPMSESALASLKRESETLKNLSHAYIPQIYDFVIEDGIVYTVMDYIEGESLDKALDRGERFTSRQIVGWGRQILEALVYLHGRPPYGILHSDIKPANIMLTPQGDVRLIDFNIALALGEDGAVSVGRSHGYASPEHYGSSVLDARSDIYGLGATLYHLLTGRRPAPKAADVSPLATQDCPPGLAALINKSMSPDRDGRFQTAAEMLSAFEHVHKNDPRARRHRFKRRIAAAATALVLAAGIFITFVGLRRMEWDNRAQMRVEASRSALLQGDKTSAVAYALEAVPKKADLFTPPVSAGAKKALAEALGVYDFSEDFIPYWTIDLPAPPLMADLSPDGKTVVAVCGGEAYKAVVFELESGRRILTIPMMGSPLAEARFLDNSILIYAGEDGLCAYNVTTAKQLWSGGPATAIAVSEDGTTVAAVYLDDSFATLYDAKDGKIRSRVAFYDEDNPGENKRVHMVPDDSPWNPRNKLLALSGDGRFLAVSFNDGSLTVYDELDQEGQYNIIEASDYSSYQGGFFGNLLVFSAKGEQEPFVAKIDMDQVVTEQEVEVKVYPMRCYVSADQNGIFVLPANVMQVGEWDPYEKEPHELARFGPDAIGISAGDRYILVSMSDSLEFFDKEGWYISRLDWHYAADIALLSGEYALLGNRDVSEITVLRMERREDGQLFGKESDARGYFHHEARVSADGGRFMFFSVNGFRLYDGDGKPIHEENFVDQDLMYDQQYSKASGNLAVMYEDELSIYSGQNGEEIFGERGLRSVFYTPYGVSILDAGGRLRLIDLDSGSEILSTDVSPDESSAAYCGIVVDNAFLDGGELIGANRTTGGDYYFAVSDGKTGTVYDGKGVKRFQFPVAGDAEAFFTESAVVISPRFGTPTAYSLKNGRKIADLEKDAYLTYITQMGDYIVSQYFSVADGKQFGVLLDSAFQPIATLPYLCDTTVEGQLVFDYQGVLWSSRVYEIEELVSMAGEYAVVDEGP